MNNITKKNINNLNNIFGLISIDNKFTEHIFKVKYKKLIKNVGTRCSISGKVKTIKIINDIIGDDIYTLENSKKIYLTEMCCMQEFLLRYYDFINKDNKRWMFTFDQYLYIDLHIKKKD
jgi:hypothetical protein